MKPCSFLDRCAYFGGKRGCVLYQDYTIEQIKKCNRTKKKKRMVNIFTFWAHSKMYTVLMHIESEHGPLFEAGISRDGLPIEEDFGLTIKKSQNAPQKYRD